MTRSKHRPQRRVIHFRVVAFVHRDVRNGADFVAAQLALETCGQTFIEEDSHLRGHQHPFAGFFEKSDGLLAGDGGEITQEVVERFARFQIIKQRAGRNARARKAGRAAHDLRVNFHNGAFLHADN